MEQESRWVLAAMATLVFSMLASSASAARPATVGHIGVPQDWSSRHVVYANPDTPNEAARKGHTAQWLRKAQDPRFLAVLMRKLQAPAVANALSTLSRTQRPPKGKSSLHRDWSNVLGGSGGLGTLGVYPAKYSFDINAAPSCANDFVVYPTAAAGATAVFGTAENRTVTFSGDPNNGQTEVIGSGTRTITLTASSTLNTGLNFQFTGNIATNAVNLAAAAHRWSGTTGIDATALGPIVTFSRNTAGDLATVALSNNLANATLGGNINGSGTAGQPTIVAFNQLYSSCAGATIAGFPNVFWSYNTGNGAVTKTSPVLSFYDNGQQTVFVQSVSGVAQLVLLKWSSASPGSVGVPTAPTSVTLANYRSCTAPCMAVMPFNGNPDDSFSSPYVDYTGDVVWVGANNGTLHKFTGVFQGTPAEVIAGGFPATVSTGNALSAPVYDFGGAQVFVGSASGGAGSGGMLHRVDPGTGAVVNSAKLAIDNSTGLQASPILDASAGRIYTFVYNDGSPGDGVNCIVVTGNNNGCRAVIQFNTAFASGNAGTKTLVGRGNSTTSTLYDGTFDDAYYSNAAPTGALYICGGAINNTFIPTLWKIPITNNVVGAPVPGATVGAQAASVTTQCSPVAEVKNGSNDFLYFSLTADGNATGCAGACVYMFNLSNLNGANGTIWGIANSARAGLAVPGGSGGIIIDNTSATTGASQIYFSNLSSPGNAFQASQALLQ